MEWSLTSGSLHQGEEAILTYMRQQNRPFAATDVASNLKGAVTKPAAQKALNSLAERGELLKKEYGVSEEIQVGDQMLTVCASPSRQDPGLCDQTGT